MKKILLALKKEKIWEAFKEHLENTSYPKKGTFSQEGLLVSQLGEFCSSLPEGSTLQIVNIWPRTRELYELITVDQFIICWGIMASSVKKIPIKFYFQFKEDIIYFARSLFIQQGVNLSAISYPEVPIERGFSGFYLSEPYLRHLLNSLDFDQPILVSSLPRTLGRILLNTFVNFPMSRRETKERTLKLFSELLDRIKASNGFLLGVNSTYRRRTLEIVSNRMFSKLLVKPNFSCSVEPVSHTEKGAFGLYKLWFNDS